MIQIQRLGKAGRFAACLAAGLLLAGCGGTRLETGPRVTETESIDLDASELTRVELRIGAGEVTVRGGSSNLMDAEFAYNVPALKPEVEYSSTGTRSDIRVAQPQTNGMPFGDYDYKWDIALNDGVRMDVIARMGAGKTRLDLGSMRLRNVEVNIGVGEVEMDLDGDPQDSYDVQIEGGIGQATVYLPNDVAISATASGGIGDIKVDGLVQRGGRYINPGHENDPVMIRLDVKGGVGEIRLVAR